MSSGCHVSHGQYWMVKECLFLMVITLLLVNGDTGSGDKHGTVLYKLSDLDRKKWSFADRIELKCRMTVGSLVPGANISDGDGERFLEYFSLIKAEAKKIVSLVARKRAMIAVVDALGGYLQAKLLPRIREQYYEGRVTYATAKRLHDIEKNIKYVLGTDGRGWARPIASGQWSGEDVAPAKRPSGEQSSRSTIRPRHIDGTAERCGGVDAAQYGLLRRWRPPNTTAGAADIDGAYTEAVPFFDNDTRPHSLVVPWRQGRPVLYGVRDAGCHQTLFDHLATAAEADMGARRSALRQWLDLAVLPLVTARLTDQWYPALWGATLVARRLKEADGGGGGGRSGGRGYRQLDCDWTTADAPNFIFYATVVLFSTSCCWAAALYIATRGHPSDLHSV